MICSGIVCKEKSSIERIALTAFAAAMTIFVLSIESFAQSSAPRYIVQNCRMDVCQWVAIKNRELVKENGNGKLIWVTDLSCTTNHPGSNYPKRYNCRPTEVAESNFVVFCSARYPAIAYKNSENKKWTRDRLTISQDGVFGYLVSSLTLYLYACHDVVWRGENLDLLGARLGYRAPPPDASGGQDEVESILDLMQ
ncbi:hypothetical protein KF707_19545 [Candidatus Obscuribacterales bacterium]|nr:hypothetical protein [Candidatus Obscuribacterales bacterium]